MHDRVQLCQDPQTVFALLRESLGVSRIILRVHGHTILEEQRPADVRNDIGQRSLERLFPGLAENSTTQATPRSTGKPPIQAMIKDAVWAGLLPEQILEARLSEVIEKATSICLCALDSDEQATAMLAANCRGTARTRRRKPDHTSLEHPSSAFHDDDSDDKDFSVSRKGRHTGPQLQAHLSRLIDRSRLRRLKDTLLSKVARQQVTTIEDLCPARVSHKWHYHLDACAGSVLTPHDCITDVSEKTRQQSLGGKRTVPVLRFLPGPTVGTRREVQRR